jgi:hypothetical protein
MGQSEKTCPHCGSTDIDPGATGLDMCRTCDGLSRDGLILSDWEEREAAKRTFEARVESLAKFGYVGISIVHAEEKKTGREWVVGIHMGREAPDSDMVGGAAYGVAEKLTDALEQALSEAGV